MEWPFSRVRKTYFSEAEVSWKIPEIPQKERFSPNFRLRNLKFQSPKNAIPHPQPFHTPTRLPYSNGGLRPLSATRALSSATVHIFGLFWALL